MGGRSLHTKACPLCKTQSPPLSLGPLHPEEASKPYARPQLAMGHCRTFAMCNLSESSSMTPEARRETELISNTPALTTASWIKQEQSRCPAPHTYCLGLWKRSVCRGPGASPQRLSHGCVRIQKPPTPTLTVSRMFLLDLYLACSMVGVTTQKRGSGSPVNGNAQSVFMNPFLTDLKERSIQPVT